MLADYLFSSLAALAAPLAMLVIGLFLAIDPALYRRGLMQLVPRDRQQRAANILERSNAALWGWLWGRLFSMTLIGVTTYVGLLLLNIPIALSLAVIAFVTNFIPYLGPVLSAVPAVLIAATVGPMQPVYVLLLYGGIQLVETNFITPLVEQQAVNLPPVFTISVQMISAVLFGPLGILLATPLSAVVVVLVKALYIEDTLGKPEERLVPSGDHATSESKPGRSA
jgi:predicted PurR-regulated permease PerM